MKLGVSACLLGEKVRYDGGHKLDHYLTETLGPFVDWVPVCPEVETGLGVPREPMRLVGTAKEARLVTRRTHIDHTGRMLKWARERLRELSGEHLCGFIFKSRSPSSGMRVRIYSEKGASGPTGSGIWAGAFIAANPLLPVEDEGRLQDAGIRENFIERVFACHRWLQLVAEKPSIGRLVEFQSDHKYLLMAHSPSHLRQLGRIVSGAECVRSGEPPGRKPSTVKHSARELYAAYLPTMVEALKLQATVRKNVNVLNHMMGYFRRTLAADEKQELLEVIEDYHRGLTPLTVPVTLVKHYVRKYDEPYLARQVYLNPHPAELMLRNHV
ncbi:MAG: YbgA family protein [Thermoleophilia bacterium]